MHLDILLNSHIIYNFSVDSLGSLYMSYTNNDFFFQIPYYVILMPSIYFSHFIVLCGPYSKTMNRYDVLVGFLWKSNSSIIAIFSISKANSLVSAIIIFHFITNLVCKWIFHFYSVPLLSFCIIPRVLFWKQSRLGHGLALNLSVVNHCI